MTYLFDPPACQYSKFDTDVVEAFRKTGDGWQTKMNDALKNWFKTNQPA